MSEFKDVAMPWEAPFPFDLQPGNCIVMYTDKGPGGPCGQSSSVTCPHAAFVVFRDYDQMSAWMDKNLTRRGEKADLRWWEVGQGGSGKLRVADFR